MKAAKAGSKRGIEIGLSLVTLVSSLIMLVACGDSVQPTLGAITSVSTNLSGNSTLKERTINVTQIANSNSPTYTKNTNALYLQTINDLPLPGDTSRLDYQSLDTQTGLLFIAHLGASSVIVFDTKQNKVVANIGGVSSVHGVLAIPESGLVYASATGDKKVDVIDEKTFKVIAEIPAGNYPDGLAYDASDHALYVSDEGGTSETVIDTQTNKRLTTIDLGGEAGNTQYDPVSNYILVDVQTLNQLKVIDPKTNKITLSYPLANCQNNHSLLVDASQRLAFITCDGNARLLVMNLQTMQIVYTDSVGDSPDVLALDQTRSLLYVATESGTVSIFDESKPQNIRKVWEGFVAKEAHTIAVNPQTHLLYLPLEDINGKPVLRIMQYQ